MPRDERETMRNGARTTAALKGGPHGGSGGHNPGKGRTPVQHAIIQRAQRMAGNKPSFWDHDDDQGLDGGNVSTTEYSKYPMHVYPWGREPPNHIRFIEVNSEAEEAEAMAKGDLQERKEDKHKRLMAIGEVKGLKLDGRASNETLEACIVAAGYDHKLDPSK